MTKRNDPLTPQFVRIHWGNLLDLRVTGFVNLETAREFANKLKAQRIPYYMERYKILSTNSAWVAVEDYRGGKPRGNCA